ncbi:outer membrane beta-barrel protein [Neolewinella agarilytica]|uniref:Outer membrane protein beta-barrel domain-containing protein n=1 Tax=Neolewinella agarilytica TaxID=478744 RepID=A0A1H9IST6_9BACT|nr:hypothetical protein [Neolewinella agarilytica]SEQ77582.1 hypothetical protein SAMN05444359_115122 [Neolewinella agarilytica]
MTGIRFLLPLFFCLFLLPSALSAQDLEQDGEYGVDWGGYLFGLKGGLSLGSQDWSGLETELLLGYHGALYIESVPASGRFNLYGQLGYHTRGSRISRRRGITFGGSGVTLPADDFRFQNISLGLGAKSVFQYARFGDLYYVLGLRAEYNLSTNLSEYDQLESSFGISFRANYPIDSPEFINEFTYGATFGAGALFPISDKIGGFVEITAHPDLSFQYNQGAIPNVIDPFGAGNRTIPERQIRNFTIEISFGIRFLRKWTYVD